MHADEKIVVCIDVHPKTPMLLRAAQRKARDQHATWVALYIETPFHYQLDAEDRERVDRFLQLAEQMGGESARPQSSDVSQGVMDFLESQSKSGISCSEVIVGRSANEGLLALLRPGFGERLAWRLRRRYNVQIIPLTANRHALRWWQRDRLRQTRGAHILLAFAAMGVALIAAAILKAALANPLYHVEDLGIPLLFLMAIAFVSARVGFMAGVVTTGLSTLGVIHFYLQPEHLDHSERLTDFLNVALFLGASLLIAVFTGHVRANAESAFRRENRTQALFKINRLTANAQSREEALDILHASLTELLGMEVAYFLPPALNPNAITAAYPAGIALSEEARAALDQCWHETVVTGTGTNNHRQTAWRFEPLVTQSGEIGVIGIHVTRRGALDSSFSRLFSALADHSAAIIERVELARTMEASRIREEREKLRSMLLSSVSHDLKTPLASVIGSLSVYHSMRATLPEERQRMLTQTALDEAQRLDSFISNILDMTRLETGDMVSRPEWTEPLDLVLRVKKRMRPRLGHHRIEVIPMKERLEVEMDVAQTEQMLQNLLDNAAKYAPINSEIEISLHYDGDSFSYHVRDHGPGIPPGKEEEVFDKYSRLKMEDSKVAGTGLGLAISRAIMENQGGRITVENHPAGGAVFTARFTAVRNIEEQMLAVAT